MENALREEVQQVVRDSLGFYWFRTAQGLHRYDGNKTRSYPIDSFDLQLPGIFSLAKDHRNFFWYYSVKWQRDADVVQRVKQIRIFDPYQERVMCLDEYLPDLPFSEGDITQISAASNRILLVLNDREVYEWNEEGLEPKFITQKNTRIQDICHCKNGTGYYYTASAKLFYQQPDGAVREIPTQGRLQSPLRLQCSRNALLYYQPKGNAVIRGAFYVPASGRTYPLQPKQTIHFLDHDDELWIFRQGKKLWFYRTLSDGEVTAPITINFDELELENDRFGAASIVDDNIWVSFFRDLVVLKEKKALFDCYLADQQISVRDIFEHADSSLLLTTYQGHQYLETRSGKVSKLFRTLDEHSMGYGIDANENFISLGMHSPKGLFLYDKHNGDERVAPFKENVQGLFGHDALIPFTDVNNNIWVGLKRGLGRLDRPGEYLHIMQSPPLQSIVNARINSVSAWKDRFWLASDKGLFLFDPQRESIVDSLDLLPRKKISFAHSLDDHRVWVIPENDHIYFWNRRLDQLDTIPIYREEWQNAIHAMLPDDHGAYWLPSNNGLFRYDQEDGVIDHFTDKDHLLPSNEFNKQAWEQLQDGRIALGGINGMIIFDPSDFADRSFRPSPEPLRFTEVIEVRAGEEYQLPVNKYRMEGSNLQFTPGIDQIIFRFSYLDVFSPEINYYYRLDPATRGEAWQAAEGPQLIFNKLKDGNHLLEIGVRQPLNSKMVHQISVRFYIQPPWYRSWWMLIIYVLSGLGFLRLLIQYRTKELKREKETLEKIIQDRTAEIREDKQYIEQQKMELERLNSLKDKLFAILGHELRAPMLSVTNMGKKTAYLLQQDDPELLVQVSRQLDRNAQNVVTTIDGLLQWGRVLLDARKPVKSRIALRPFLEKLTASVQEQFSEKEINVANLIPAGQYICFDKEALVIIFRNLLNNAFKFSENGTNIQLNFLNLPDGSHEIRILDQGMGLPPAFEREWQENQLLTTRIGNLGEKGSGLGLHICRLLADRNCAVIAIKNRPEQGTCSSLTWNADEATHVHSPDREGAVNT